MSEQNYVRQVDIKDKRRASRTDRFHLGIGIPFLVISQNRFVGAVNLRRGGFEIPRGDIRYSVLRRLTNAPQVVGDVAGRRFSTPLSRNGEVVGRLDGRVRIQLPFRFRRTEPL